MINNINTILLAALTTKQKQLIDEICKRCDNNLKKRYDIIFKDKNRIYLPNVFVNEDIILSDEQDINMYKSMEIIDCFFLDLGKSDGADVRFCKKEYLSGKFIFKNREYKIGKILNDIKNKKDAVVHTGRRLYLNRMNVDNIISVFNDRPSLKDSYNEYIIVISRDPYDIAGMSTDKRWHSCMELKNENGETDKRLRDGGRGGPYRYYIANDLKEGTLISYLINKNDTDINNPVARILIKPFINAEGDKIYLYPESKIYRDDKLISCKTADKFLNVISNWAEQQQADIDIKSRVFFANPKLYVDGKNYISTSKDNDVYTEDISKNISEKNKREVYENQVKSEFYKLERKIYDNED